MGHIFSRNVPEEDNEEEPTFPIGSTIHEHYTVQEILKNGSFASIYKCRDERNENLVTLKLSRSNRADIESRYENERRIIMRPRGRFPMSSLMLITDSFPIEDHICIVTNYYAESLRQVLATETLNIQRIRHVAKQLLQGIRHLHSLRVVHRNLNPDHIMVESRVTFNVKIIDLTSLCPARRYDVNACFTVPAYEAPEIPLQLPVSSKTDLWNLAILIVEMSSGEQLFPVFDRLSLLSLITEYIGRIPNTLLKSSRKKDMYFFRNAMPKCCAEYRHRLNYYREVYLGKKKTKLSELLEATDSVPLTSFVRSCLKWQQAERPTVRDCLIHQFIATNND